MGLFPRDSEKAAFAIFKHLCDGRKHIQAGNVSFLSKSIQPAANNFADDRLVTKKPL